MIVVAVIGLLAAIAIPNITRARITANENATKRCLRVIAAAAESFRAINTSYPGNLSDLSTAVPPYLDGTFVNQTVKSGYRYLFSGYVDTFYLGVAPATSNSGTNYFCIDSTGVIYTSTSTLFPANGLCPGSNAPIS